MNLRARFASLAALVLSGAIGGSAFLAPRPAEAAIVERVVAVVGERPILLSELRQRARPHLYRIAASTQNATQQAAAESEMFRELLSRIIDERLIDQAADKAHITVTADEVDAGLRQVAAQARMDVKQLVVEAKRQGLSEQDHRDEIRRQLLEGKLVQLRVRGRVRVTEQDAHAAYSRAAKELVEQSPVEPRILVLTIPPGTSPETARARVTLAEELVRRAKGGEDFCNLVSSYSEDQATKSSCGSRGTIPLQSLFPELQQIAMTHKAGEVADPVLFRDPTGAQAVLVVQMAPGQLKTMPPFEDVREQMMERAFMEATERQRKLWLQELRRGVYIDVRL